MSVCVCVSVCLSVQAITLKLLKLGTSFSACGYILIISRSSLSIKVMGQGQGKMYFCHILTKLSILCISIPLKHD